MSKSSYCKYKSRSLEMWTQVRLLSPVPDSSHTSRLITELNSPLCNCWTRSITHLDIFCAN